MFETIWRRARLPGARHPARTPPSPEVILHDWATDDWATDDRGTDDRGTAGEPPALEGGADPVLHDMRRLDAATSVVSSYLNEPFSPCGVLINPLLGLWEAAHDIDPAACAPVEELLTVLLQRSLIASAEVVAVIDDVRARAIQGSVLAHAGGRG